MKTALGALLASVAPTAAIAHAGHGEHGLHLHAFELWPWMAAALVAVLAAWWRARR
ncbi:MAG TPA: hypothetical protein PLF63_09075 [Rubrivivax sp.]|nr:hypothetical protein [Rubrivivax sp.]